MLRFDVISVFPELVEAVIANGIPAQAVKAGLLQVQTWNPRDFTHDRHRTVDDRPYGGGPGMVMKPEPLEAAMLAAESADARPALRIYMSPQGRSLDQAGVEYLATRERLIVVAGRYEGIDERFIEARIDEEWSIGDYVLSGGELPAMVLIDALVRQIPGALGHAESAAQDSFADGLLDCPHYTRPERHGELAVPDVLLGGNHEAIRRWRLKQALGRTWQRRSDLLKKRNLSQEELELLDEFKREQAHD